MSAAPLTRAELMALGLPPSVACVVLDRVAAATVTWRSLAVEVPPVHECVLLVWANQPAPQAMRVGWRTDDGQWMPPGTAKPWKLLPTHWAPLPAAPAAETPAAEGGVS